METGAGRPGRAIYIDRRGPIHRPDPWGGHPSAAERVKKKLCGGGPRTCSPAGESSWRHPAERSIFSSSRSREARPAAPVPRASLSHVCRCASVASGPVPGCRRMYSRWARYAAASGRGGGRVCAAELRCSCKVGPRFATSCAADLRCSCKVGPWSGTSCGARAMAPPVGAGIRAPCSASARQLPLDAAEAVGVACAPTRVESIDSATALASVNRMTALAASAATVAAMTRDNSAIAPRPNTDAWGMKF
eukprot:scaffold15985_cov112-Isochrysis_galbana.AAC.1